MINLRSSRSGLGGTVRSALPLLISIGLLLVGSGLASTMLGVRASIEGFRPVVVGLVLSGYYAGYVGGSYFAPPAIRRVGHVRVFGGLAALAAAGLLVHVLVINPASWFLLRVLVGLCISALYVVCETWLNGVATNRTRGGLFAVYMIVVSLSLLGGQFVFAAIGAHGFEPFVLASILVSLAVVPVSLASFPAPILPDPKPIALRRVAHIAPLAIMGAAASGFVGAAMLSAGVVFATQSGFNRGATGAFVGASLAGGVCLQFPLGWLSDRVDRRGVLALTALVGVVVSVITSQISRDHRLVLIALTTIAGGAAYPIYSLGVAHLNDYIEDQHKVAAGSKMILVNGLGAVAGPIVGSLAIEQVAPSALYLVIAVVYLAAGMHALYRMTRRSVPDKEDRFPFSPVAVGVGPTLVIAEDVEQIEFQRVAHGLADHGGTALSYLVCGTGPSVMCLGSLLGAKHPSAHPLLSPLAADGFQVIVPVQVTPAHFEVEAVLDIVRSLNVRSLTLVGVDDGIDVVDKMARDHREWVDAVVLISSQGSGQVADLIDALVGVPVGHLEIAVNAFDAADLADDIAAYLRPILAAKNSR